MFTHRVSDSKWNLMFYEIKLVTRKKTFYKDVQVSNSKCDIILYKSIS